MSVLDLNWIPSACCFYWRWFGRYDPGAWGDGGGKFLYFARDPELLYGIAVVEIMDHGFEIAKVCLRPNNGRDYVLCLYAATATRLAEVESRYEDEYSASGVTFRGWKSNAKTKRQAEARGLRRAECPWR